MDNIRTEYENEVIQLIKNNSDDKKLGKTIRKWYLKNKEDLEYETPESFRESEYTDEQKWDDFKNGLSFGMK